MISISFTYQLSKSAVDIRGACVGFCISAIGALLLGVYSDSCKPFAG